MRSSWCEERKEKETKSTPISFSFIYYYLGSLVGEQIITDFARDKRALYTHAHTHKVTATWTTRTTTTTKDNLYGMLLLLCVCKSAQVTELKLYGTLNAPPPLLTYAPPPIDSGKKKQIRQDNKSHKRGKVSPREPTTQQLRSP